jgi:hypothetical protein
MPRTELSSQSSAMLRRFAMVALGRVRVEGKPVEQNADAHVVPSYPSMACALLPDGSLRL